MSCGCLYRDNLGKALIERYTEEGIYEREKDIYKKWKEGENIPSLSQYFKVTKANIYLILKRAIKRKRGETLSSPYPPNSPPNDTTTGKHRRAS